MCSARRTADLTLQHYAVYLFEYVKQRTVVQAMKEYLSLPLDQMDLETGMYGGCEGWGVGWSG